MLHTTTAHPGRARPTPRPGGAAGRRHADHAPARRRLSQPSTPDGPTSARWRAWTPGAGTAPLTDALLAAYLGALFEAGRAPATAALAVAAVRFRATLAGQPAPAGAATARVLGGFRRTAADRGRGQAAPLRADGLAAILATAARPRTDGRGVESPTTAHRRGRLDAVIASLLFMGGLRRSEVAAVRWADVTDASDGDGVLAHRASLENESRGGRRRRVVSKDRRARKRSAPSAPTGPTPHPRIGWSGCRRCRFSAASPLPPAPPASRRA